MGGCATKPKVFKATPSSKTLLHDDAKSDHKVEAAQAEAEEEAEARHGVLLLHDHDIIELDHQPSKRPSLSCLFNQNEEANIATKSSKILVEEILRQEPWESQKQESPVMGLNESHEAVKQQSQRPLEKFLQESQNSKEEDKPSKECVGNDTAKQEQAQVKISAGSK